MDICRTLPYVLAVGLLAMQTSLGIGAVLRELLIAHFWQPVRPGIVNFVRSLRELLIALSIMAASKASHEGRCEIL